MSTILLLLWVTTYRMSPQFKFPLVGYLLAVTLFLVWTDGVGTESL